MASGTRKILKRVGVGVALVALAVVAFGLYLRAQMPKPIGDPPVLQSELFTAPATELPVSGRFIFKSATELAALIRNRQATATEIVQEHINYIKNTNYRTNAFVWLFEREALEAARRADEQVARGEPLGLLHGVPVSIKEEFWVQGKPNTVNAEMFRGFVAPRNAKVVDAWLEQGAILLGTTNVSNLLFDVQTHGEIYPTGNNPYDAARTPGGSTGGGAASVAAGLAPLALGGDMGGSIRVPAAFCGVYGLKPTEESMGQDAGSFPGEPGNPRYHRMAVAGPLARTVDDVELGWNALMAHWPEARSLPVDPGKGLDGYRVAWFDEWKFGQDRLFVGHDVKAGLARLVDALRSNGATVTEDQPDNFAEMKQMHALLSVYMMFGKMPWIIRQFVANDFKRKDNHRLDYRESLARISDMDEGKYDDILRRRAALTEKMERFFDRYDLLLMPVTSGPAIAHNERHEPITLDGTRIDYWDYFHFPMCWNATGHPALTIPLGLNAEGVPIAIQVVGPLNSERRLLAFARLIAPLHEGFVRPPAG